MTEDYPSYSGINNCPFEQYITCDDTSSENRLEIAEGKTTGNTKNAILRQLGNKVTFRFITDSGSTIIGTSNRITGGGGHYIVGIGNEANTTSAQIIGFSNTISAGLAIGKYLSNTDTNGSRITIGAYNNASVDIGTRVVFGDGTGTSDRHNLFISDYNHNTYFSGNIYGTNLPDAPNTAGTYTLQCVVTVDPDTSEVSKSYSWV